MAQSPGFDMSKMSTATKILLGAGVIFLIDSFLPYWNRACIEFAGVSSGCFGTGMWNGIGVLTGLVLVALVAWEAARAFGALGNVPARTANMVSVGLAAGVVVFTLIKILVHSEALSFGAYLGIALALVIAYGGYMRWQEAKAAPAAPPAAAPPPPPPGGGGFTS